MPIQRASSPAAQLDEDGLTLVVDTIGECDSIPWGSIPKIRPATATTWWVNVSPCSPRTTKAAAPSNCWSNNSPKARDRQRWEMVSSDGDTSNLDICFLPEGPFYTGQYYATDDSCSFLSCGGSVTGALRTESTLTIYTACRQLPVRRHALCRRRRRNPCPACGLAAIVHAPCRGVLRHQNGIPLT